MMLAIVQDTYGPPAEVLRVDKVDEPVPGPDGVLLRVRAAGVNWSDWALTRGEPYVVRPVFGLRRPRQRIRGVDVAGEVVAVGDRVTRFAPGDRVFGWCEGAFAELVATPERTLVPLLPGLSFEAAAGVPQAGFVAIQALRRVADVRPGQHVLVNGASGGIGTLAVQVAKALGAEVTGVCSTPNLDLVRGLGADHVLDYTREDFTRGGARYDVVLDMADVHTLAARRRVLTRRGTLIPNNGLGGRWVGSVGRIAKAWALSPLVSQRLKPFASSPTPEDLAALADLLADGRVTPVVGRTYPLDAAAAALTHVGAHHTRGKVVVTV